MATTYPMECVNCRHALASPVYCADCRRLYPAESASIFELFSLPETFDVDLDALRSAYLSLSRQLHPDRVLSWPAEERDAALRLVARLNQARDVLVDETRRAEYLLERAGGASAAADKSTDGDVLGETLMLREEIDDARSAGDAEAIAEISRRVAARQAELIDEIRRLARLLPGDVQVRSALRAALNADKYFARIAQAVER